MRTAGDPECGGSVSLLFAILAVAVFGFVALGTDIVVLLGEARKMQSSSDAAALGAVSARIAGYPSDYTQEALAMAAAGGFQNGQAGTDVIVNSPPASGKYTSANDAVEVLIAQPQTQSVADVVYGAPMTIRSRSVARISDRGTCLLALDNTSSSGTLSLNGSTAVNLVNCSAWVNSSSTQAVSLVGGSTLNADRVTIVGGYSTGGGAQINATGGITTNAAIAGDPYANYPLSSFGACNQTSFSPYSNPPPASPGVYCNGITLRSGVALTLNAGIYIIDRGSLNLAGGASLSGSGVTIVLTSSTGANYATVSINGGATLNVSAPTTGTTAGLVFFQDRRAASSGTNNLGGGTGQNVVGGIYFPQQTVQFAGGNSITTQCTQIVARVINFVGNAVLKLNCSGTGVLPIAGTPLLVE